PAAHREYAFGLATSARSTASSADHCGWLLCNSGRASGSRHVVFGDQRAADVPVRHGRAAVLEAESDIEPGSVRAGADLQGIGDHLPAVVRADERPETRACVCFVDRGGGRFDCDLARYLIPILGWQLLVARAVLHHLAAQLFSRAVDLGLDRSRIRLVEDAK